eukprot:COSAG01_NODE_832_length_13250_cov_23.422828_3_plen_244_part_00
MLRTNTLPLRQARNVRVFAMTACEEGHPDQHHKRYEEAVFSLRASLYQMCTYDLVSPSGTQANMRAPIEFDPECEVVRYKSPEAAEVARKEGHEYWLNEEIGAEANHLDEPDWALSTDDRERRRRARLRDYRWGPASRDSLLLFDGGKWQLSSNFVGAEADEDDIHGGLTKRLGELQTEQEQLQGHIDALTEMLAVLTFCMDPFTSALSIKCSDGYITFASFTQCLYFVLVRCNRFVILSDRK